MQQIREDIAFEFARLAIDTHSNPLEGLSVRDSLLPPDPSGTYYVDELVNIYNNIQDGEYDAAHAVAILETLPTATTDSVWLDLEPARINA